jgi:hypothetical protein
MLLGRCFHPNGTHSKARGRIFNRVMSENKRIQLTSISEAQTLEEIGEFWDTRSLVDYWDKTHEVDFELRAQQRRRVTVEPQIYKELETEARSRASCLKH